MPDQTRGVARGFVGRGFFVARGSDLCEPVTATVATRTPGRRDQPLRECPLHGGQDCPQANPTGRRCGRRLLAGRRRDGETRWVASAQLIIPHPILIDGLAELREIAVDLSFSQAVEQIFRPIFAATAA